MVRCYGQSALGKIWKRRLSKFASTHLPESSISKDDFAILLAVHYDWDSKRIRQVLRSSRDAVYAEIGLCLAESTVGTCCICVSDNTAAHPVCGHACKEHLPDFLVMEVEAGKAILRCPNHVACHVKHLRSSLHDEKDIARFEQNIGRSFVYCMKKYTICKVKECSTVIRLDDEEKTTDVVTCARCETKFCFQCKINHFPASCEDNHNWSLRLFGDGIKPCPHCQARTSKHEGCLHMVCKADGCGHEYCWFCLKKWSDSHDFYTCSSAEDFGGTDRDVIQCEEELRKVDELLKERFDLVHSDDAAINEILKSHILGDDASLLNNDLMTAELIYTLKWFSICFRYHPNKREDFQDDVNKVRACIRENLEKFPKLDEMATAPREPIRARTESGNKLTEELYTRFKVDSRVVQKINNVSDDSASVVKK